MMRIGWKKKMTYLGGHLTSHTQVMPLFKWAIVFLFCESPRNALVDGHFPLHTYTWHHGIMFKNLSFE